MHFKSKSNDVFRLNCEISQNLCNTNEFQTEEKIVLTIYNWCFKIHFRKSYSFLNEPTYIVFKRRYCLT